MSEQPAPARPSASVVIVRDQQQALQVLLVQRNERIAFHGGAWVFPGGRVDAADAGLAGGSELDIAKRAAVREALEETGLVLDYGRMHPFAHWTTPVELPKRFATWFFAALPPSDHEVRIDNSEIVDYRWMTPQEALAAHAAGELNLPAPTYVTLLGFQAHARTGALFDHLHGIEVARFVPRLVPVEGGRCTLYGEDAGYETLDFNAPGARHRLIMQGTNWRYIREY